MTTYDNMPIRAIPTMEHFPLSNDSVKRPPGGDPITQFAISAHHIEFRSSNEPTRLLPVTAAQ